MSAPPLTRSIPIPYSGAAAFRDLLSRERFFLLFIGCAFLAVGLTYQEAAIARWVGFALAGYSAVANDSIQTIGTFIASNEKKPWWALWVFMAVIFVATAAYSWVVNDGDVSYQRLASKGFSETPSSFTFFQIAAPLFLMVLTRMRMPVSTTFMLLSTFSTSPASIGKILNKSLGGYVLAFALAIALWLIVAKAIETWMAKGEAHPFWRVAQWITSGVLWSVWLMQDAANIAVYLPRSLGIGEFLAFAAFIVAALGILFYMRGERIQSVVNEKKNVVDVRSATIIDLLYAVILFYFKMHSKVPMSTTWVFVGLLAGREIAIQVRTAGQAGVVHALRLMFKDLLFVTIGLVVSLLLAAAGNESFRAGLLGG